MLMQLVFAAGVNLFSVSGEDAIRARAARLSEKLSLVYFWPPERDGREWGGGWIVAMAQTNMAVIRPCNFAVMCECVTAKLLFT